MSNPHPRQLLPGHTEEVTSVHLATGWFKSQVLLFNNEHASACRPGFSSARVAVGTAVQSSADFLHLCNWAFCLFLFLAQSGLKLAAIFLLPPIAGTTRHAPPHLALWSLGESYIPPNTCYSGSRTQMLAWKNLHPKVQWHKCAGSLVNHMATSLHISHRTLEAWLLHVRDKHF